MAEGGNTSEGQSFIKDKNLESPASRKWQWLKEKLHLGPKEGTGILKVVRLGEYKPPKEHPLLNNMPDKSREVDMSIDPEIRRILDSHS